MVRLETYFQMESRLSARRDWVVTDPSTGASLGRGTRWAGAPAAGSCSALPGPSWPARSAQAADPPLHPPLPLSTWVAINLATRKLVRLPDETRDFFHYFEPKPARCAALRAGPALLAWCCCRRCCAAGRAWRTRIASQPAAAGRRGGGGGGGQQAAPAAGLAQLPTRPAPLPPGAQARRARGRDAQEAARAGGPHAHCGASAGALPWGLAPAPPAVLVRLVQRVPGRRAPALAARVGPRAASAGRSTRHRRRAPRPRTTRTPRTTHTTPQVARRSDMDMNGHINNVNYLAWALETVPRDVYDSSLLKCAAWRLHLCLPCRPSRPAPPLPRRCTCPAQLLQPPSALLPLALPRPA
jgi:hypothetical protein